MLRLPFFDPSGQEYTGSQIRLISHEGRDFGRSPGLRSHEAPGIPLPDRDGPCTGFVEGTRQADPFLIRYRGDSGRGIYFVFWANPGFIPRLFSWIGLELAIGVVQ